MCAPSFGRWAAGPHSFAPYPMAPCARSRFGGTARVPDSGTYVPLARIVPQRQARRISHRSKTDLLSISVTHRIVAKNFDLGASIKTVTLSVTPTVPFVPKVGRLPTVPLFGSHTHSPIGRAALRGRATGSHPEVTPSDDSPSPKAGRFDRTRAHAHARANVPHDDHKRSYVSVFAFETSAFAGACS